MVIVMMDGLDHWPWKNRDGFDVDVIPGGSLKAAQHRFPGRGGER